MKPIPARGRWLDSTRGRVVSLLLRGDRTVLELAVALGLTRNAIRGHLAGLERDGLARHVGVRRGVGKPAGVYRLTPEGERLFPTAYAGALAALVAQLVEAEGEAAGRRRLREAGARLGRAFRPAARAGREERLEAALAALASLGAVTEVEEEQDSSVRVRGLSCPLGEVVREQPLACGLVRAMVREITGAPVDERCERGERPRCEFLIRPPRRAG